MKLLSVDIENFGVFTGKTIGFGEGGFHLVYGPNEAGKSTLLQLIRELLFGFPQRSDYAFASHSGEMAAVADVELDDGRRLRYRRRKGRANTVVGEFDSGETIDADAWSRLLGAANESLYANVFGFSLRELSTGEKSLSDANLSEALYGGGLGGLSRFQEVQADIAKQSRELYAERARNPRINELLRKTKESQQELKNVSVSPREYGQLREEQVQLHEKIRDLQTKIATLQTETRRWERLQRSLGPARQIRELSEQIESTPVPSSLTPDAPDRFRNVSNRLQEIEDQIRATQAEATETAEQLQSLILAPEAIENESAIRLLYQDVRRMEGFIDDLPKRLHDRETLLGEIRDQLASLDPSWTLEHLDRYEAGAAQTGTVKSMAAEAAELKSKLQALQSRRPDCVESIEQLTARLENLPAGEDLAIHEDLLERAAAYQQSQSELDDAARERTVVGQRIAQIRRKLQAGVESASDDFENLPVPRESAIEEFRRRFSRMDAEMQRHGERIVEQEKDVSEVREKLLRLQAKHRVPDREHLLLRRRERDELWRQIREWIEDPAVEPVNPDRAADDYEDSVAAADRVADERQAFAEQVAQREQLEAMTADRQAQFQELRNQGRQLGDKQAELQDEWRRLWESAGIVPAAPESMRDWLAEHRRLLEAVEQLTALDERIAGLQKRVAAFEAEVRDAVVGADPEESFPRKLARLKQTVRDSREAEAERKQCLTERPKFERRLAGIDAEIEQTQSRLADWESRWRTLLHDFGFPETWSADLALEILSGLAQARSRQREVASLDQRISDMEQGLADFNEKVLQICRHAAPHLAAFPSVAAVAELSRLLDESKQAERDRKNLLNQQTRLGRRLEALTSERQALAANLSELLAAAEAKNAEEFRAVAEKVRLRSQWIEERAMLERELRAIRENEDAEAFAQALAAADPDELAHKLSESQTELKAAQEELQRHVREDGALQERLDRLNSQTEATQKSVELENYRAALKNAVDQWAPLALAQAVMERAIRKFERERQPEMLKDVGRLLRRMTLGRYVALHRDGLNAQGDWIVEGADGTRKRPSALSTGTREQLYLAIRLAYVRHYCNDGESLPVVMDDVLVNFDDRRADGALDALLEFSQSVQVVLLTCHQATLERVRRRDPSVGVTELSPIAVESAV